MAVAPVIAQKPAPTRPDLSGRWRLNRERSDDASAKLEQLHASSPGGHGPARHGGAEVGDRHGAGMQELRDLLLDAPSWFVLTQDGDRLVLTGSDGRTRTLTANGRKERVEEREVRTKWDRERLVSEISLRNVSLTETFERSANAPELMVTMKVEMGGQIVNVRRLYELEGVP